jgi:hypothetical protein
MNWVYQYHGARSEGYESLFQMERQGDEEAQE